MSVSATPKYRILANMLGNLESLGSDKSSDKYIVMKRKFEKMRRNRGFYL